MWRNVEIQYKKIIKFIALLLIANKSLSIMFKKLKYYNIDIILIFLKFLYNLYLIVKRI